jgi:hypothetical protein
MNLASGYTYGSDMMIVMKESTSTAASVSFSAPIVEIKGQKIVLIPEEKSVAFSSRGQVSVRGSVNGYAFSTVLEPDGRWSHWFRIDAEMHEALALKTGDDVAVELEQVNEWPEPAVPEDFAEALGEAPDNIQQLWSDITPMARWEWVRWINATREQTTRQRRVQVSISKMQSGKRRPCCFNLAACTDPELSRSGRLMESASGERASH